MATYQMTAARRNATEVAARCGLTARGVLYVLVGLIALRIAFGENGGKEADRGGALQEMAQQPYGRFLVWAFGVGIACMALWRLSQAVYGAAGPDGDKKGKRLGAAARAVFYTCVAVSVFLFAAGQSGGGSGGDRQQRDLTAKVLDWPGGQWIVGAVGVGVAAAGVWIAVRAAMRSFRKHLRLHQMPEWAKRLTDVLGVCGGISRGLVFAVAGGFAVKAAVSYDPHDAKGLDDTLRTFAGTAVGPWALVAVAAGLALFGLFSFAMARWRKV